MQKGKVEGTENNLNTIPHTNKKKTSHHSRFFAGLFGSTASSVICAPLDLIKVRLQVQYNGEVRAYNGVSDAVNKIYSQEGIRGFFKGVRTTLVTVPVFYSLYFPLYEFSKTYLSTRIYGAQEKTNLLIYSLSATLSAIACDFITNPMWVVRVRHQTEFLHSQNSQLESFNIFREMRKIMNNEGFLTLYRGFFASLLGIPHVIIQFSMYETLKSYFAKKQDKSIEELPYTKIFASSIISKSTASLCTYPHEVIRNSIQNLRNHSERTGIMRIVIRNIIKNKGYKGFYTGFFLNLFRILPNNSVMFLSYEYLTRFFTN